jgi:5-methylcytosine-specific restriction enzyme subunit McrC
MQPRALPNAIPVRNLWFLLMYAYDFAHFGEKHAVEIGEDAGLPELIARLLISVVERRIKRNLTRAYEPRRASLTRVRGRIDIPQTVMRDELRRGRIACRFEAPTVDSSRNRLVRYALTHLAGIVRIQDLAFRCRSLALELERLGVSYRRPTRAELSREQIGRHDADDRVMIAVAVLALDPHLPTEADGDSHLTRLERDERLLRRIFEKAVTGFYMHELNGGDWTVSPQKRLDWPADAPTSGLMALLPVMRADIVIDHRPSMRRLVIDTKFTRILKRNQFGAERFSSAYVYQMFAYLRSQSGGEDRLADGAAGMLLHPAVGRDVQESVTIQGHRLHFATVDLSREPQEIRRRLLELVRLGDSLGEPESVCF